MTRDTQHLPSRDAGCGRPRVAALGADGPLRDRLRRLADGGAFELADLVTTSSEAPAPVDVVVALVTDADATPLVELRRLHRTHGVGRTVAVGEGVRWFEEAFDAGADAWVDRTADDHTLLTAIRGRRTTPTG